MRGLFRFRFSSNRSPTLDGGVFDFTHFATAFVPISVVREGLSVSYQRRNKRRMWFLIHRSLDGGRAKGVAPRTAGNSTVSPRAIEVNKKHNSMWYRVQSA